MSGILSGRIGVHCQQFPVKLEFSAIMKPSPVSGKRKATAAALRRNRRPAGKPQRQGCLDNRLNREPQLESLYPQEAGRAPSQELWVAPKTSLTRERDDVGWSMHSVAPNDARLLELADIALGLRKPHPFRKRRSLFLAGIKPR